MKGTPWWKFQLHNTPTILKIGLSVLPISYGQKMLSSEWVSKFVNYVYVIGGLLGFSVSKDKCSGFFKRNKFDQGVHRSQVAWRVNLLPLVSDEGK